ncbi:MAG: PAS domain S-box protein [Bdellovibrionales bacterium]|nr:PAS domain S-box protein [Bdellovibrionales bacterium]
MGPSDELKLLLDRIAKLEKINRALMDRVENTVSQQGSAFSFFEKNSLLQTEVEKKTNQLENARLQLQKTTRALNEAVMIVEFDKSGKITGLNDKFRSVSGYGDNDILGKHMDVISEGFLQEHSILSTKESSVEKKSFRGEVSNRKKDGSLFWSDCIVFPIMDKSNQVKGYISVGIEITEKKLNQEKLYHSDKLASIGVLAAGVGHEINNPLAISAANLSMLRKQLEKINISDEKIFHKIEMIEKANHRIKNIVDGLRTYSRIDTDLMKDISLKEAIQSTLDLVSGIFKSSGINIIANMPPDSDYLVYANSGKMQQILMNLLTNARDAVETCSVKDITLDLKKISTHEVEVCVADTGVGVPEELINKIMEPFFTTKEVNKGTGIGLGLVDEFVKSFRGRLEIQSKENQGSQFRVILPLKQEVQL